MSEKILVQLTQSTGCKICFINSGPTKRPEKKHVHTEMTRMGQHSRLFVWIQTTGERAKGRKGKVTLITCSDVSRVGGLYPGLEVSY